MRYESVLTCPICGFKKAEVMPTDRCVIVYDCEECGGRARPKSGDSNRLTASRFPTPPDLELPHPAGSLDSFRKAST